MKHYAIMIFICLLTIFTIVACTVGPDYKRPNATVPSHFKEAKNNKNIWRTAKPNDACERGDWWKIFHDKELSRLEEQLNKCNQSVAVAAANYMQAQALVEEARANYFPVLTSSASLIRQKGAGSTTIISTSNGGISTGGGSSTGITATSSSPIRTDHAIVFDASWQPDIWGLTRRTVEATEGGAQASAAQLALTRLSSLELPPLNRTT